MAELTPQQQVELQKELERCKDKSEEEQQKRIQSFYARTFHKHISKEAAQKLANRVFKEASHFRQQFRERTSAAIIAAFGFLIALAWQDLIKNIVTTYTSTSLFTEYPYLAQLISALIVTVIAVFAIMIVSRWARNPQ